jgi:dihydrofolate synthase/folylpolyglutamate synthase
MDHDEALRFFASAERFGVRLGLERMRSLMDRLGGVPRGPVYVHVAGTNGKGSITAFIASALAAAGYRTGIYTSPFLFRFEERIRFLDGAGDLEALTRDETTGEIPHDALARLASRVRTAVEGMLADGEEHPTEFELITAVAFLHYEECRCDVVVLETGLGGRLDATNVIPAPAVSVIAAMGYDHCDRLGSTMREIAGEKAAIVKSGTRVVLQDPVHMALPEDAKTVESVVRARCDAVGASLAVVRREEVVVLEKGLSPDDGRFCQTLRILSPSTVLKTSLVGAYQPLNAATAFRALEILAGPGGLSRLDRESIARGFEWTRWPCRFEFVSTHPPVVMDGAHNPQGAVALRESLREIFPDKPLHFVCGVSADKDYPTMLRELLTTDGATSHPFLHYVSFRCVAANHPRALAPDALAEAVGISISRMKPDMKVKSLCSVRDAVAESIREAESDGGAVCVFGSLFLMRDAREAAALHLAVTQPKEGSIGWIG